MQEQRTLQMVFAALGGMSGSVVITMENPFLYTTISVEIFGASTSLILFFCLLAAKRQRDRMHRVFMLLTLCNALNLFSDGMANLYRSSTSLAAFFITRAGNFMMFCTGYILSALFVDYFMTYIGKTHRVSRKAVRGTYALCAVAVLMVIISQFNGMYYDFVEPNIYRRGELFWVGQAWGIVFMFLILVTILRYRKHMRVHETLLFLSYILLQAVFFVIQLFVYGLSLTSLAQTLTLAAIYIGIQAEQAKNERLKELELSNARISIMLSQIRPHFLYNTLSAIDRLYFEDLHKGHEAMLLFSRYLRGNMDSLSQTALIPFEKELEHTKQYLNLEKLRFQERLQVVLDTPVTDFMAPVLTLQPIVENAVRYGATRRLKGGTVAVRTEETDAGYRITVQDDGPGFDPSSVPSLNGPDFDRSHLGISNVRERLKSMYGGSLRIESALGQGTTVIIELPKQAFKA